jgi:hypothetical protein
VTNFVVYAAQQGSAHPSSRGSQQSKELMLAERMHVPCFCFDVRAELHQWE